MGALPTVRIKDPANADDFIIINESDFNPGVHEKFEGEPKKSAKPAEPKPGTGGNAGAELPEGYRLESAGGGYYHLFGPEEQLIEGPSNGKWQGKEAATAAAHDHANRAAAGSE